MSTQSYTMGQTAAGTGMPRPRLAKQIELGLLIAAPIHYRASCGQGRAALFTFPEGVMHVALHHRLTMLGVHPREASQAALSFSDLARDGRQVGRPFATGFTLFVYPEQLEFYGHIVHCKDVEQLKNYAVDLLRNDPPLKIVDLNLMYEGVARRLGRDPLDYRKAVNED